MSDTQTEKQDQLAIGIYFPVQIFSINKFEYLAAVRIAADAELTQSRLTSPAADPIYPVRMTGDMTRIPELKEFSQYILATAWNILQSQGYAMADKNTYFLEFWCQEHQKHSSMDQHVHAAGAQLSGFYFIDSPKDGMRPIIYDPRAGKVQSALPEADDATVTPASSMINFEPTPGLLWFSNAWLPHSFSRHRSKKPARFLHFTIGVVQAAPAPSIMSTAEVI